MTAIPKTAPIRLRGKALEQLRRDCFDRDIYKCQECGYWPLSWYADSGRSAHMAHIKGRGRNGSDTLENVRTLCPQCHADEHNAGGKPCPKKLS